MKNLLSVLFFSVLLSVNQSLCARPLHGADRSMTFFIDDVLSNKHTSSTVSVIGNGGHQVPFAGPVGLPNQNGGRSGTTNPHVAAAASGSSARGGSGTPVGWLSFLTSLQALESGNVTVVDEELTGSSAVAAGQPLTGRVQGVYVACSSERSHSHSHSHMVVAVRAIFGGRGSADSLRFFGEHRTGLSESHIAVVGGTGRYDGANGFVVVKEAVGLGNGGKTITGKKLEFIVYIK